MSQSLTTTELLLTSAESRIETRTLLWKELSKNLNSFDRTPWWASLPGFYSVSIGHLVYLYCDQNKYRGRDHYLVTSTDGTWCQVREFVGSQLWSTTYRIKKASATKYLWMLHLPCQITRAVHALTAMTRMIPLCYRPHHHRYLQLLPHPHLNFTEPQKMPYLRPPHHQCPLLSLLLFLIPIQILTVHPYHLPATSQTRTSCPNDPQPLTALRNT